jgi:tripartite-type tricarboxylate transporter receptor subunit TctC
MNFPRRQFLQLAVSAGALSAVSPIARARAYPSRPISMIVPFPAGGPVDAVGRILAERMQAPLGQPIIIENVGGADGSIGTGRVAQAKPDGYTIDLGVLSTHVLNGAFHSLRYDVLEDFAAISLLVTYPNVLYARKTMPAKDLPELVVWLKENSRVSVGAGAVSLRLLATFFQKATETQLTLVPYRGTAPTMQDLVAGQIDLSFNSPDQLPLVRAGSIKAYAVTGDTRLAFAPDIPTFGEMGLPSVSYSGWYGLFAPRGTPKDIIGKLNAAAVEALADPRVRTRLVDLGYEVFPRERQTPEILGALVKADAEKWWPIIKELGIRAE